MYVCIWSFYYSMTIPGISPGSAFATNTARYNKTNYLCIQNKSFIPFFNAGPFHRPHDYGDACFTRTFDAGGKYKLYNSYMLHYWPLIFYVNIIDTSGEKISCRRRQDLPLAVALATLSGSQLIFSPLIFNFYFHHVLIAGRMACEVGPCNTIIII